MSTNQKSKVEKTFESLWKQYIQLNPEVEKIHDLFIANGHTVVNDHIALRTFNLPKVSKEKLAKGFVDLGYQVKADYNFKSKKLDAIHLEHDEHPELPKVFISELKTELFSDSVQKIIKSIVDQISEPLINDASFCHSGATWNKVSIEDYEALKAESEYAAWVSVFGYMANHFTVKINELGNKLSNIEEVNQFVESAGYEINSNGGKIKGTPEVFLVQSSTLANKQMVEFSNGKKELPTCFYEFAYRYKTPDGTEFSGFIADNADKIFTSTNAS
jgi:hypothetical protein